MMMIGDGGGGGVEDTSDDELETTLHHPGPNQPHGYGCCNTGERPFGTCS